MSEMMRVVSYEEAKVLCEANCKTPASKESYGVVVKVIKKNGLIFTCKNPRNSRDFAYYSFELRPLGYCLGEIYE